MSDVDVLVVGGGLGGCIAALSAASEAGGQRVRVVSPRERPFEAAAGLIDVLGSLPGEPDPVPKPFEAIDSLPATHPYRRLGTEALRRGLDRFDRATAGTYAGSRTDRNGLVPTALGGARPVARYPAAVEPGLLSRSDPVHLVGFISLPDFDPRHAAERLRAMDVPFSIDSHVVSLPLDVDPVSPAASLARSFDVNDTVGQDVPYRTSAARLIRTYVGESERIGLPAVLGVEDAVATHATVSAELDADVFEIPLGPPSVLGRRLGRTLRGALADAGVELDRARDVRDATVSGGTVSTVELDDGETIAPESVVLAPGGLAAGGLRADRDGISEPRFGCHVPHPADRTKWAKPAALDAHEMATFGLDIDETTRPRDSHGAPVASNLYAAGRVVGGGDFVAQGAVGGIALATGYVAGTGAGTSV